MEKTSIYEIRDIVYSLLYLSSTSRHHVRHIPYISYRQEHEPATSSIRRVRSQVQTDPGDYALTIPGANIRGVFVGDV